MGQRLSGPLNRLNAILSLLHPLDHYRTPSCDRERDWEAPSPDAVENRGLYRVFVSFRSHPGKPNQRKASSRTFRRGIPEQKFNVNRACFPKEKHQNSQKWAKFMSFSFCPFLWFGLPGRLLIRACGKGVLDTITPLSRG